MPPVQRGHAYRLGAGRWGLRYYDRDGERRRLSPFPTKSAALAHYRDVVEPRLRGEPESMPALTLGAFVGVYLERHRAGARPRTIGSLRQRLRYATDAYGDVPLVELERMVDELADWQARLPARSRYGILGALRQTLGAAIRWGHMSSNPAKLLGPNRQPPPRPVRAYTYAELDAIAAELSGPYRQLPTFAAATGLRPEEWAPLEPRDVDRRAGIITVRRTVSDGEVVELGKTSRSRRQVPLTPRALAALDEFLPRIAGFVFPGPPAGSPGSTTSAAANGRRRSRRRASRGRRASTTCARRSRRTRSRPA